MLLNPAINKKVRAYSNEKGKNYSPILKQIYSWYKEGPFIARQSFKTGIKAC